MRSSDSRTIILILIFLFIAGLIFSSYIIYRSFELVREDSRKTNTGRISLTILPEPEALPEATGRSTISFKVIEKPEE